MLAREIMTVGPSCVTPDDPLSAAAELMRDLGVGIVPVVEDRERRRLVGVITDRDIAVRCVARHHELGCLVHDHMTGHKLHTVSPNADVAYVMEMMEREQVRRVPVVHEDGSLVGIIAQADMATKLGSEEALEVKHMLERISEPAHVLR
jgi:CBS domain-containing protein